MNLRLVSVKQYFVAALLVFFSSVSNAEWNLHSQTTIPNHYTPPTCDETTMAIYNNGVAYKQDITAGPSQTTYACWVYLETTDENDTLCPAGQNWNQETQACLSPYDPTGTQTEGGWNYDNSPIPLDGEPWDGSVVDDLGQVWENTGSSCDPVSGICIGGWEATDQVVDPLDPSTWPPGSISTDDPNSPIIYDENGLPTEGDPFTNPGSIPTVDPVIQNDSSSTSDSTTGTTTDTSTVETLSPDGDRTETHTETITNSDGSSTVSETVTHHDEQTGVTTTTETVTDYDAQGVGTVTISGTSEETDQENKAAGGSGCTVAPICSGDGIQCAILYQQWKTRCEAGIDESGITIGSNTQFDTAIDGTGVDQLIAGLGTATVIDAPAWGVDTILPSGSSGCSTITFSWAGSSVVFPSSSQCSKINVMKDMFGYFLYILTAMSIFQIATRRPA